MQLLVFYLMVRIFRLMLVLLCICLPTRQPPIQSEKYQCRIDTVISPDNGHIVARNMYRS